MRGIGLLALLVVVGLMFYLMFGSGYGSAVSNANKEMKEDANAYSGRDADGRPAHETATYKSADKNGKVVGIKILTVEPGAALDTKYGLKPGDVITGDGTGTFDQLVSGADDFKGFITNAYQRALPLEVTRGGAKIRLPDQRMTPAPMDAATANPAVPPTQLPSSAVPQPPQQAQPQPQQQPRKNNPMDAARNLRDNIEKH